MGLMSSKCFGAKSKSPTHDDKALAHKRGPAPPPAPGPAKPKGFHEVYKLDKELGTGAWGKVYVCFNRATKDKAAVKMLSRNKLSPVEARRLFNEIEVLGSLDHPNIIKLLGVFEEPERCYLVLEICTGGELLDKLAEKRTYTEKEARDLVTILLDAIAYMHEREVVHRDIKPENLLLTNSTDCTTIKLADFGFAEKLPQSGTLTALLGSPSYLAPEILSGTPYGLKIDCWSIGVIVYILLGGYTPFTGKTHTELFRKIKQAEFQFHETMWGGISTEAKELISGLLTPDPTRRLSARSALTHRWFGVEDHSLYDRDLNQSLSNLRSFNARRKFRAAADAVKFINKVQRTMGAPGHAHSPAGSCQPDEGAAAKKVLYQHTSTTTSTITTMSEEGLGVVNEDDDDGDDTDAATVDLYGGGVSRASSIESSSFASSRLEQ